MPPLPDTCCVALKEWALIIEALAQGSQLILLRKGGLIEQGSRFRLKESVFLLYPTYEHQNILLLRPPARDSLKSLEVPLDVSEFVSFKYVAQVVWYKQVEDASLIKNLGSFHCYTQAFIDTRLKWKPKESLSVLLLRVLRLAESSRHVVAPDWRGCRSWVTLNQPVSLKMAEPVLAAEKFDRWLADIQAILG